MASVFSPVMPLYIRSLGIGEKGWGIIAMFQAVGMVATEWLWGALSDRGRRMRYALFSLIIMSILYPLYTFHDLFRYLLVIQVLFGAFSIIIGPVSRAIVTDHSPNESIGFSMAIWSVTMTIGTMIGNIVGSYIADVFGFEKSFYLSSILSLLGVFATYATSRAMPETVENREFELSVFEGLKKGLGLLISNPSLRILLFIAVSSFAAYSVLMTFLPLYASDMIGMSIIEIGMLRSVMSLTSLIATVFFGKISDSINKRHLVAGGFLGATIFFIAYPFLKAKILVYLVSIGVSIFMSVYPLVVAMVADLTPRNLLGLSMGVFGSFEDTGFMIGPAIYGLVWTIYQPGYVFLTSAVFTIICFIMILRNLSHKPVTNARLED